MISTDLKLIRKWFTANSTIGELYSGNTMLCYILEDVARPIGVKVDKQTCICEGEYIIAVNFSNRFQRQLPIIYNTLDLSVTHGKARWTGVRIHPGNTAADTEGCLLPGMARLVDKVAESRSAFDELLRFIQSHPNFVKQGKLTLTIINEPV